MVGLLTDLMEKIFKRQKWLKNKGKALKIKDKEKYPNHRAAAEVVNKTSKMTERFFHKLSTSIISEIESIIRKAKDNIGDAKAKF